METVKDAKFYVLLLLCSLVLFGCSQKADENKPVSEVKAEAEKMDTSQLRSMAMSYKDAVMAKKGDVEKLAAKLKGIPVAEKLGAEAKEIKAELDNLNKSVSALKERMQVYYNKLKEKGGDTSGLDV